MRTSKRSQGMPSLLSAGARDASQDFHFRLLDEVSIYLTASFWKFSGALRALPAIQTVGRGERGKGLWMMAPLKNTIATKLDGPRARKICRIPSHALCRDCRSNAC